MLQLIFPGREGRGEGSEHLLHVRARGEEGSGLLRTGLPAPRMYTAPAQLCPGSEREGTKRQKANEKGKGRRAGRRENRADEGFQNGRPSEVPGPGEDCLPPWREHEMMGRDYIPQFAGPT